MALVTYLPRAIPLVALANRPLPPAVQRWLQLLSPAIMAGLVAQAVFMPGGQVELSGANPALFPAAVTALVAWRTRSLTATVLAGMAAAALVHRL
ncbi:MAG: AzlD domain-containing protein [Firmicutes bacterium]|nr:AzlD domain-containing protein [Bacillota bacterium]